MLEKNKSEYRGWCKTQEDLPLFFQDWWLDVVCGKSWGVCMTKDKGGAIRGILPFQVKNKMGQYLLNMPLLTPFLGPHLIYSEGLEKAQSRYSFEKKHMSALISQLPPFLAFYQKFGVGIVNALPFIWRGFRLNVGYFQILENLDRRENIFRGFKDSVRNKIRKAAQNLTVEVNNDANAFYHLQQKTFENQNMKMPFSGAFFRDLDQVLKEKKCRKIYWVIDGEKKVHSAAYFVWDSKTVYCLAAANDYEKGAGGAYQLLIWQAIQDFGKEVKSLHFAGSVLPKIADVNSDFGAQSIPYLRVRKFRSKFWEAVAIILGKQI